MSDPRHFALVVLLVSGAGLLAVLANRFSERLRIPLPVLFLGVAAIARQAFPQVDAPTQRTVERVVTIALLLILFDGGLQIGWARFRAAAAPIAVVGVLGTFLTVAAVATLAHLAIGLDWYVAVLVATAIAPTDPAVVFSVLGSREIAGRSSTILEGESGANDPVGIALMAGLITAGEVGPRAIAHVGGAFLLEMIVGLLVGVAGGFALLWSVRAIALPSEALYPLRTLAVVLVLFGVATLAHGSGFLAVFAAGIVVSDARAPYKREVERFHAALASLGEIVAFGILGLTVDLHILARTDVWAPGLLLGAVTAAVIRPLVVGLCLVSSGLTRNERAFVLFAGLKGAVPILLGSFILAAAVPDGERLYGIVVVVVIFSVVAQGTFVPAVARRLGLTMRTVKPEPWALGVRLRDEPQGVHHLTVAAHSRADGRTLEQLGELPGDAWVSFVVRDRRLVAVRPDTVLRAGDEVLILADGELGDSLAATFGSADE